MATQQKIKTAEKVSTTVADTGALNNQKNAATAAYKAAEYKPSTEQQAYKKALENMQNYNSQYKPQIDSTLSSLQKGYNLNTDPNFKQYQETYTRNAQQASRDIIARQAALNGGAASSMAQRQANQAYQNTMQGLYDLVPQLSQQWTSNQQALLSAYQNQDQLDYEKYTDNRTFYQNMYLAAQDRDMQLYDTELQKMYNTIQMYQTDIETAMSYEEWANEFNRQVEQDGINNAIAWAQQELDEAKLKEEQRQFNQNFAEEQRQYNATLAEQQRQYNSDLAEQQRQYNASQAEQKRQYDQNYNLQLAELARQAAENEESEGGSKSTGGSMNITTAKDKLTIIFNTAKDNDPDWARYNNVLKQIREWYADGKINDADNEVLTKWAQKHLMEG